MMGMSIRRLAGISMAGFLAACSSASTGAQSVALNTGPDGEPVVCRKMQVTGTRFPLKECKTEEAWAAYDEYTNANAKESTDKYQRLNTGCSTQAQGAC
jgi:ABC-type glycerol-3-phosphate transport system substrate-binding protein